MLTPKLMAFRQISRPLSQYYANIISGPPRTRVSFAEKAATGVFMGASICVVPGYILYNLKYYTAGQK